MCDTFCSVAWCEPLHWLRSTFFGKNFCFDYIDIAEFFFYISILFFFQLFVQPYKFLINKTIKKHPPSWMYPYIVQIHIYISARYLSLYRLLSLNTVRKSLGTRNLSTDIKVLVRNLCYRKVAKTMNLVVANINFKRITWNSTENS